MEREEKDSGGKKGQLTICQGEVEVVLLVAEQLVAGGVHGEHPEGGVATAIGSHRWTDEDHTIRPVLVLYLMGGVVYSIEQYM